MQGKTLNFDARPWPWSQIRQLKVLKAQFDENYIWDNWKTVSGFLFKENLSSNLFQAENEWGAQDIRMQADEIKVLLLFVSDILTSLYICAWISYLFSNFSSECFLFAVISVYMYIFVSFCICVSV